MFGSLTAHLLHNALELNVLVPDQARRRALGNIQFIGFLFKKKMLTEKIMHSCIMRLMGEVRARSATCVRLCVLINGASPVKAKRFPSWFEEGTCFPIHRRA